MIRKSLFAAVVLVLIGAFGASAGGLPQATYIPPFDNVATHFLNGQGGFTIPTSAAGAYAGAYQVNNAGVLGGGNIHHSAGVSTWQVDDAGHVIAATFHQTGQYVEWWAPSGETRYWSRNGTQSWHYDDPAGVTSFCSDNSGVTSYHPTGDVRYGTYLMDGVELGATNTFPLPSGVTGAALYAGLGGNVFQANAQERISGNTNYTISGSGNTIFSFCWDTNVWNRYNDAASGGTLFTVDKDGFHGTWAYGTTNLPDNAVPWDVVQTYDAFLEQSKTRSGISNSVQGDTANDENVLTGNSLYVAAANTSVILTRNNAANAYQLFGLPPISGNSIFFFDIQLDGNAGGYVFEMADEACDDAHAGAVDTQMIVRAGGALQAYAATDGKVTGFVIPPNTSYERYLIKGFRSDDATGVSNTYLVEATSASGVSILNRGPGW